MSRRSHIGHDGGALPGVVTTPPVPAAPVDAPTTGPGMTHYGPHIPHRWHGFHGFPYPTYPLVYEVRLPSAGIEISDLLTEPEPSEEDKKKETTALAKEIVKQLKKGKVVVGDDLELLDAEMVGEEKKGGGFFDFSIGPILQAAGGLAEAGINIYEKEQAKKDAEAAKTKSAVEERSKIQAAIAADAAAAQAAARAAYSAKAKLPSAAVDAAAANQAAAAQARAAAGLSPESLNQRLDAANQALSAATKRAQINPKDGYAVALMEAWTATANKIQNAQFTDAGPGSAAAAGTAVAAAQSCGADGDPQAWLILVLCLLALYLAWLAAKHAARQMGART